MYEAHFGFRHPPFGLTPDTRFFFAKASQQEALNTVLFALRSGEGFLKVTGEIGLGKTLLCRQLLNSLGPEFVTAYIPNPAVTPDALFRAVAEEFGCEGIEGAGQTQMLKAIHERLLAHAREQRRSVLIVDEAQALSDYTLEAIRLLTNLETETYKLLQVVLFGQPELDQRLAQPQLRQLRQRVTFAHRLRPLSRAEFTDYVRHRLDVAGAPRAGLFSEDAMAVLYRASRGTPRLINILCHKALLAAFGPGRATVRAPEALAAIHDTESVMLPRAQRAWMFLTRNFELIVLGLGIGLTVAYLAYVLSFGLPPQLYDWFPKRP